MIQEIAPSERGRRLRLPVAQPIERSTVVTDQRFFLFAAPPFQLMLARDRTLNRSVFLRIDHTDRPPGCCVLRSLSIVVSMFPRCEVLSVADVQRAVSAADDVCEGHSMTMPSSSLAKQDEGIGPSTCHERAFEPLKAGRMRVE